MAAVRIGGRIRGTLGEPRRQIREPQRSIVRPREIFDMEGIIADSAHSNRPILHLWPVIVAFGAKAAVLIETFEIYIGMIHERLAISI